MFGESVKKTAGIISVVLGIISAFGMFYFSLTTGTEEGLGWMILILGLLSPPLALASFFTGVLGLFYFQALKDRVFAFIGLLLSTGTIIYFVRMLTQLMY
jgi:hypothetical protein